MSKLELLTYDNLLGEDDSLFKNFDLVDFFDSSEYKSKIVNFNFLEPTDYDEQKDFFESGKISLKNLLTLQYFLYNLIMTSINSINGMTHIEATKLRRARVRTTVTFLQIASSRSGRALLTKETGISSPKLFHWAKRAELMKIRDLGRDYSDLLEAVGVESVSELKRRNPESLHESMSAINNKQEIVDRMPSLKELLNG